MQSDNNSIILQLLLRIILYSLDNIERTVTSIDFFLS